MAEDNSFRKYEPFFGSWYIKKKIGKGSIGRVYEIERKEKDATYRAALKVITIPEEEEEVNRVLSSGVAPEDLADYYRNLVDTISSEYRYLAKLKGNSYIVNYEDHMVIEEKSEMRWHLLIKTELLKPLVESSIKDPLDEQDVVRLGIDICRALQSCSKYNIVHRDIKPENIFITAGGEYKLGDFGVARIIEETQMNLSRKGTYAYMAPEVFHGEAYGQSADLYSLGLVMYKFLNKGRMPFMPEYPRKIRFNDGEKAFTIRMAGTRINAPAGISPKLQKIVEKACAFDRSDRYETAEEMLIDLEALSLSYEKKKHKKTKSGRRNRDQESDLNATGRVDALSEYRRQEQLRERCRRRIKILATTAFFIIMIGIGVYISIPKEVTDIEGIDSSVVLYYDGTLQPDYSVKPDWFEDEKINFASGDEGVFTVSDKGEIKAVSIGTAELTMKAKEYTETVSVSIVPKVTEIKGIDESYALITGNATTLEPQLSPAEFADEPVTYTSADENIAAVGDDGTVTAVSAGETAITIYAGGTEITTKISVSNPPPVVRKSPSSKKSSGKSKNSGKTGSSAGKFNSGDDEYF